MDFNLEFSIHDWLSLLMWNPQILRADYILPFYVRELEHPWSLVSTRGPGTNPPRVLGDDYPSGVYSFLPSMWMLRKAV